MATANIGGGRILRACDLCGGVDDHPRHVIAGGGADVYPLPSDEIVGRVAAASPPEDLGRLLRELSDTSSRDLHLDCCAANGCPTGTCGPQVETAKGKTGKAMLAHVMGLPDPFADRPNVVTGA